MSENDPTPSKQTSSIPLKKETVRVTLKAADAPPASPSGAPTAPAVRPPTPTAPPAPTVRTAPPAPTAPAIGGAPRPAPAATIPLKTAPGAAIPKPAPTIPLKSGPVAPASAATAPAARAALPGAPAAGATIALPKATVPLTSPGAPTSATFPVGYGAGLDEEEEVQESSLANILSIVGFVAALVVLYFQFDTAGKWINAPDNEKTGWGQLFE
jgi:hypothetical protein